MEVGGVGFLIDTIKEGELVWSLGVGQKVGIKPPLL